MMKIEQVSGGIGLLGAGTRSCDRRRFYLFLPEENAGQILGAGILGGVGRFLWWYCY